MCYEIDPLKIEAKNQISPISTQPFIIVNYVLIVGHLIWSCSLVKVVNTFIRHHSVVILCNQQMLKVIFAWIGGSKRALAKFHNCSKGLK